MNCGDVKERINDYVDGVLTEDEGESLRAHLAACAGCRRDETALRVLLDNAASLEREIMPQESLWEGIAERTAPSGRASDVRQSPRRPWAVAAAAALLVVAAAAVVTTARMRIVTPGDNPAVHTASEPSADDETAVFAQTRKKLLGDYATRKGALPPGVAASVEGDLLVIDGAVAEIRAALDADPGNGRLRQTLVMVYEKQVGLLAQAVRLANDA